MPFILPMVVASRHAANQGSFPRQDRRDQHNRQAGKTPKPVFPEAVKVEHVCDRSIERFTRPTRVVEKNSPATKIVPGRSRKATLGQNEEIITKSVQNFAQGGDRHDVHTGTSGEQHSQLADKASDAFDHALTDSIHHGRRSRASHVRKQNRGHKRDNEVDEDVVDAVHALRKHGGSGHIPQQRREPICEARTPVRRRRDVWLRCHRSSRKRPPSNPKTASRFRAFYKNPGRLGKRAYPGTFRWVPWHQFQNKVDGLNRQRPQAGNSLNREQQDRESGTNHSGKAWEPPGPPGEDKASPD